MNTARQQTVVLILTFVTLVLSACGTTRSSRSFDQASGGVYKLTEEQADRVMQDGFTAALGDAPLAKIASPHSGYQTTVRVLLDTHNITAYAIKEPDGYSFQVIDNGSAPTIGGAKANDVMRAVIDKARAIAGGRGVASESKGSGNSNIEKLRELSAALKEGLITQEEYNVKKKKILNGL